MCSIYHILKYFVNTECLFTRRGGRHLFDIKYKALLIIIINVLKNDIRRGARARQKCT